MQPGSDEPGASPLDGPRDKLTQREQTPDKPDARDDKPPQEKLPGTNGDPRSNKKPDLPAANKSGTTAPTEAASGAAHTADALDRWGFLPEHARDVFRMQGGGDLPARYRQWIDAYYKKLNQKR